MKLWKRIRYLLNREMFDRDLQEEMRVHREMAEQKLCQLGTPKEEAHYEAMRAFGNATLAQEASRAEWTFFFATFVQDIGFGARMLRKSPGFTAVAILTLGLGIGANTAIFSMVNSFLLRPLAVKDPNQITVLALQLKKGSLQTNFSFPELNDLQSQSSSVFSDVIGDLINVGGLTVDNKTEPIVVSYVSGNFFPAFGIKPFLGRLILPSEGSLTSSNPVIVLGYTYWQTRFASDPSVVGKTVLYDGHPVTVIGVTPKEFHGLNSLEDTQGYLPFEMYQLDSSYTPDAPTNRENRSMGLYARLRSDVSLSQAQSALNVLADGLSKQYPKSETGLSLRVFPERFSRPNPDPDKTMLRISLLFLILAGLVLVLACVNVANFLLVRATARRREIAIRTALGGTRLRLIRQLLTESVLLALCGGVAGIFFGLAASNALSSMHLATTFPIRLDFQYDWRVFGYAFAAALLTGLIVGIFPALRASRREVIEAIREGGRSMTGSRSRLRTALVVVQVGGSLMLLIVAGLTVRSLSYVQRSDLGFDPRHVLNLAMDPNEIGYDKAQGLRFYNQLIERINAMPGVESSSVASSVPMGYYNPADSIDVPGYEVPSGATLPYVGYNVASPGYFRTMSIPLLEGRDFMKTDLESTPWVAIVNEAMAKEFWPKESAIGHEFRMVSNRAHSLRIVGVVKNSSTNALIRPIRAYFYVPLTQQYSSLATVQVRTAFAPETIANAVREEAASLAPSMPIFDVKTMVQGLYTMNGLLLFQLAVALAGTLGALGLILALVGIFGVISFAVSQRTNEIGIRVAMGASQTAILRMILRQGVMIVSAGLLAGLALALAIARLVGNFIEGVSSYDPVTYLGVSALLSLVALFACYIPARRAMRVDPIVALRYE